MLSEEEKKAIERLEEQLNFWKKQNIKNSDCEIILNLMTKLQKENENIKKQNEFLSKGYRAMNIALDYQRAIVSILRTLDIKEIEIDDKLLYTTEDEIRVHSTINHTTIIKLVEKE